MRILLAVDGSISSDRARDLVSGLALPDGSQVRLVAVDHHPVDLLGLSWVSVGATSPGHPGRETEAQAASRHLREALARAESQLERPGISVESLLLRGRAATAIVDEAVAFDADLVVLGSRGHGPIASMLLGSTAAEVVDHAPCPVLVARAGEMGTIAFADDGSPAARLAERVLATWPIFVGRRVHVVTVVEVHLPAAMGLVPGVDGAVLESYEASSEAARDEHRRLAHEAALRLNEAGHEASATVLEGQAAPEILRFATDRGIGTLVLGTRGHTGLTRMMLGSVARNVLVHSRCSVLIVRQAARLGGGAARESAGAADAVETVEAGRR